MGLILATVFAQVLKDWGISDRVYEYRADLEVTHLTHWNIDPGHDM